MSRALDSQIIKLYLNNPYSGDSYSRTGFNPSSSSQPSRGNPLGNPAYPGVTSANGPNWVDYLTTTYNKSSLLTYNFGTSGAVVAASIVNANGHDLHQEVVEYFQPRYKVGKTFHASTSLFVTWFGINDIMHGNLSGRPDTVKKLFEAYGQDIGRLYKSGARNFLLMTVPPVERAPRITNQKDPSARIRSVKEAVETWNSHVKELAKHIETVYPKSTAFVFDTYPLFSKVIEKPSAFKETKIYKDTTTYCSAYKKYVPARRPMRIRC